MEIAGALVVFAITLALIMTRPKGITEWVAALMGAGLMLLLGRVTLPDAVHVLSDKWDVYLFFLGLMLIAVVADVAGFFDWTAALAVRTAGGNGRRLFLNVFLLGTLITTFLSNDATALILSPVVYTLVTRLRVNPLPFMFACTFIADTASLTLPVSNPINILVTGAFPKDLGDYWKHLLLPSVLAIIINLVLFFWLFRHQLPANFNPQQIEAPGEIVAARGRPFFGFTLACLSFIAIGYVVASLLRVPVSFVALGGGLVLVGGALVFRRLTIQKLGREISWSIFLFISGMFIVVRGMENAGLTRELGNWLLGAAGTNLLQIVLVFTFATALGTNFINNVPMTLVMISTIEQIVKAQPSLSPDFQSGMVYSTIIGADLGPNLTTVGSLATVLWIVILRRKGFEVSPLQYFRLGIIVTPVMLGVAALALWLSLLL